MIKNIEFIISKSSFTRIEDLMEILENKFDKRILRWFISRVEDNEVAVEMTLSENDVYPFPARRSGVYHSGKNAVINIIPTGIGCEMGGYAADAAPITALLASCTDYLITNPNAVNASNFIYMPDNVLYTEGFMIDQFSKSLISLYRPYANKVGVIIEKSCHEELEVIFNIINTTRAVYGVDIEDYIITDGAVGGYCEQNKSGSYVGKLENTGVLIRACDELIKKGVNAIAVTSNIKDLSPENYAKHFAGEHPNPVGGAEAIISHLIGAKYKIPAAHAPLINLKEMNLKDKIVDARGAGEFSSISGLGCILVGLAKAPQISERIDYRVKDVIDINNVLAVVAPATALGGIPMLCAQKYGIPIIAVRSNNTILDVTCGSLNLNQVTEVENYAEAAGLIQALKNGISLKSIYRPLETLRPTAQRF